MRYLRQFMVIVLITFIGEVLHVLLPFPIPASIYGLVIMLVLLETKLLDLEDIKETGLFLVEIMPILFIPPGVGLMVSAGALKEMLLPALVIIVVVTFVVMAAAGHASQFVIRRAKKKDQKGSEDRLSLPEEDNHE